MNIVVTGGSGFIGSHVVDRLQAEGHQVTVVDVRPPDRPSAPFQWIDLLNPADVVRVTKGVDAVYHLAAVANVNHAFKDPLRCVGLNVQATANVLEAARVNGVSRVMLASTVWVYNAAADPVGTERASFRISDVGHLYTASKLAAEMLCHSYWQLYQVPFTILRYGIPYGPRMRDELVIPIFLRKALAGEPLTINGDGRQYRKFVYVEDLAAGNVAALAPKAKNQTYNLEGTEAVSILEIAEQIKGLVGNVTIQFTPGRPGDFSGREIVADKAAEELGWRARTPFAEGLRKTYQWYVAARNGTAPVPAVRAAQA